MLFPPETIKPNREKLREKLHSDLNAFSCTKISKKKFSKIDFFQEDSVSKITYQLSTKTYFRILNKHVNIGNGWTLPTNLLICRILAIGVEWSHRRDWKNNQGTSFRKSHNAKKLKGDPLVSHGIVCYAERRSFYNSVPWAHGQI